MDPNQPLTPLQKNPAIDEQLSTTQAREPIKSDVIRPGLPNALPTDEETARDLNLSPGEELLCLIGRHPIGIVQFYVSTILGIAVLLVFLYFFITHKASIDLSALPDYVGVLVVLILAIILWGINTLAVRIYKMNRLILTTEALIVERQQGLFNKDRKSLSLESIEDVSFDQKGILQPMFNYGTLEVATVGKDCVTFAMAEDPKKHADYIENAREQLIKSHRQV